MVKQFYQTDSNVQSPTEPLTLWLAQHENAPAQNYLGMAYIEGTGVTQDYVELVKWFRKAAEQRHANAQGFLRTMNSGRRVVSLMTR